MFLHINDTQTTSNSTSNVQNQRSATSPQQKGAPVHHQSQLDHHR